MPRYSNGAPMKNVIAHIAFVVLSGMIGYNAVALMIAKEPSLHSFALLLGAMGGILILGVSKVFEIEFLLRDNNAASSHNELLDEIKKGYKSVANIVKAQADLLTEISKR